MCVCVCENELSKWDILFCSKMVFVCCKNVLVQVFVKS